ncbi:MAG: hypothetical protein B0A82_04625 [Alkalinema sp. CACIAM 70d]|nr:MAG: hypothetical protein B0A82_04625 [Alkalinema sp. CACIAM 70d]
MTAQACFSNLYIDGVKNSGEAGMDVAAFFGKAWQAVLPMPKSKAVIPKFINRITDNGLIIITFSERYKLTTKNHSILITNRTTHD